ncbi:butyrophilin subfamily 1 member A1-like [Chanos chanos]|uniref:Butyrophilin subfamily 1 member A1-like n=1 Tax=Chanos chanos TaxID=29144 RepID=A0A6J2WK77_CHACN|nr:butyrophilin subfamily 1 member A1-like [Chanos chanos]
MWVWMFVSVPFCHAEVPETFSVLVPDGPVSAKLGSSVVLPCSLTPSFSAVELEVLWYRPNKLNTPILALPEPKVQETSLDPQYRDRVSLIGSLEEGNVSLKLENITLSDRGEYVCHVSSVTWYDKGTTSLTVNVLGSEPVLSFTETGQGNLNVTCVSDGWSPQPTVTWRDREEKEINKNANVMYSKDSEDLVSVSSWLLFSPSESEWISCSVSLSDQEKREGRVLPLREAWRAFIVMLVISLLAFSVLFILFILYKRKEDLRLDKSSCHKDLTVKKDGKEVSFTKGWFSQNPSELMVDVLCKENFKSGCHYWEVFVLDAQKALPPELSWYVDRGPQFTGHEMVNLCKTWGATQKFTTSYHPQANLTEWSNHTIKTMERLIGTLSSNQQPPYKLLERQKWLNKSKRELVCVRLDKPGIITPTGKVQNSCRETWVRTYPLSKASDSFSSKLAPKWSGPATVMRKLASSTTKYSGSTIIRKLTPSVWST